MTSFINKFKSIKPIGFIGDISNMDECSKQLFELTGVKLEGEHVRKTSTELKPVLTEQDVNRLKKIYHVDFGLC